MQPNFTLKNGGQNFIGILSLFLTLLLSTLTGNAQQYINGNLSTGATTSNGTTAPAGFTWSEMNATNTTIGYGNNITDFRLADNFTVPAGTWNVTKMTFYAYSTNYAGATSPFNDVRVRIYNGAPNAGGTVIFGDVTTNRFLSSTTASIYRIVNATPGTARQVWAIEANVNVALAAGTYWVEWGVNNTTPLASNFTPPSTITGQPSPAGSNALQLAVATNTWTAATDGAGPQDIYFKIDYTTGACTGTPAPGNTISSAASVCPTIPFTLSLQNATSGSGITYQWQSGPSSTGPWTNIAGATNSTYTTTLAATTWYRCNVTCSAGPSTGTSNPVQVSLTPPSGCYCNAGATSTSFEKISNVTFGTINNNSTSTAGYENFTALSTTVIKGQTLPISVSISGAFSSDQVLVWIDFNQNGSFSDPGEQVYVSPQGVGPHVGNITISPTALTGPTRMRVRMHDAALGGNTTPCGNSSFGQVEDYTVNIQPCTPLTFTAQPSSAAISCGGDASFTVGVTGSVPVYGWEYRVNSSSPWQFVTNTAPFSGATTATLSLTNVSAAYNGYQFRALVSNPCNATDFSSIATLTVNPIVPVVNPSSATICLGSIQQLTLTNTVSAPVTSTFTSGTVSLTIPENGTGASFGSNTIAVSGIPAGALVTDVKVRLNMNHNWVGDVCYVLRAPNNQILNLDYFLSSTGGSGTNFLNTVISSSGTALLSSGSSPFTGTFRADAQGATVLPGNPPSGPAGFTPTTTTWNSLYSTLNGNWTLAFYDYFVDPDPGTFTKWDLEITYVAPVFAQGVWGGPAGTIFSDAAATVPYTGTPATTVWVKPTATGVNNYTVNFTTTTPCTSATTTVPVTVHSPVTGIAVSPSAFSVCLGSSRTLTASTTGGTPVNYQWQVSVDGGVTYSNISGATGSSYTVSNVTSAMTGNRYRVTTTGNVCGTYTSTPSVLTVLALPTVSITSPVTQLVPGRTTSITGTSTPAPLNATSWSWTYNGSPLVTTPASNTNTISGINIDRVGSYRATVTDVNGCTNSSNTLVIGSESSDRLWIYPNPTTGAFQVRLYYGSDVAEKRAVHIYDQLGQIIMTKEFNLVTETPEYLQMDFDLSKQARGVYVVKVVHKYSGKIVSGLVIKQ